VCEELEDCGTMAGITPDQAWFLLPLVLLATWAIFWASSLEVDG
jgi:hypothetical protein